MQSNTMVARIKLGKRELAAQVFDATGARRLTSSLPAWSGLLVLNYHRIGTPSQNHQDRGVFSATADEFEAHIKFLRKEFDVIQLADINDILSGARSRGVLITFDDGYRDNYELAFPVLKAQQTSAVFFVTTGFLDDRNLAWWDEISWMVRESRQPEIPANRWTGDAIPLESNREPAVHTLLKIHKRLPWDQTPAFRKEIRQLLNVEPCPHEICDATWMTWEMVREMHRSGMEIQAHTVTHPVLANLPVDAQRREIAGSRDRLQAELGHNVTALSYPVGQSDSFTQETQAIMEDLGLQFGFSFMKGIGQSGKSNRFALPRMAVNGGQPLSMFRALVTLPQVFGQ